METSKKTTVKRAKPQPPKVEPGEEQVLQFKLTLDGLRPKIWRRVQVCSATTMFQFAHIIMELFQMENAHLYAFTFPETEEKKKRRSMFEPPCVRIELFTEDDWSEPDGKKIFDVEDPSLTLATVLDRFPSKKINFEYDYGDGWSLTILFEKVLPLDAKTAAKELPCVLKGEGYGILEDCGGPWGFAEIVELAYRRANNLPIDESDEDVEYRLEWVDALAPEVIEALINPTAYDLDAANKSIRPMVSHSPED